jgi:hypothetical protein
MRSARRRCAKGVRIWGYLWGNRRRISGLRPKKVVFGLFFSKEAERLSPANSFACPVVSIELMTKD